MNGPQKFPRKCCPNLLTHGRAVYTFTDMTNTLTAPATGRTAAISELAAAWRAVDVADMSGDDAGDRLIRETYALEDNYVAAGVLTRDDVTTAREMAAADYTAPAGMTPAARASIAAHVAAVHRYAAIVRVLTPAAPVASSPAPAASTGATFGPWASHAHTCQCNVCR